MKRLSRAEQVERNRALVLDAGAGEQPYRHHFLHCRYEAADFEAVKKRYATSTYVCDLARIPVEDGRFDAVVFSQVMEHLPDPIAALREIRRVAAGTVILDPTPATLDTYRKRGEEFARERRHFGRLRRLPAVEPQVALLIERARTVAYTAAITLHVASV